MCLEIIFNIYNPGQKYKTALKNEEKDCLQFFNYENRI